MGKFIMEMISPANNYGFIMGKLCIVLFFPSSTYILVNWLILQIYSQIASFCKLHRQFASFFKLTANLPLSSNVQLGVLYHLIFLIWSISGWLGEGVSGHCLIWASGMLPPKLRHILGCLAISEEKKLSKKDPTPVKTLFENTMGNPFFDFFNTDQTLQTKK